jgi:poly [ADP-ribose] polymerase 10/14/15
MKLFIVKGDITTYKVDVIVNAANERMEHVGGVAKAIVDKGLNTSNFKMVKN